MKGPSMYSLFPHLTPTGHLGQTSPSSSLLSTWNFAAPKLTAFQREYWQKKPLTLKVCIEKRFQFCSQMYLQYQQTKPNFWCKIKQNWMQGWHYGKELIYYKPILWLTKLAFLIYWWLRVQFRRSQCTMYNLLVVIQLMLRRDKSQYVNGP